MPVHQEKKPPGTSSLFAVDFRQEILTGFLLVHRAAAIEDELKDSGVIVHGIQFNVLIELEVSC